MKLVYLMLVLVPFLSSCDKKNAQQDGHIVGNGGDYLENLFIQGKLHSARVLQKLQSTSIVDLERDSTVGSRSDLETLKIRGPELMTSIRESKHEWDQKLPLGCPHSTCGCTLPNRPNTVFLSYDNCREVQTVLQAGSVLVHESTHAVLRTEEPEAQKLTSVAYELWAKWGHADTPHWRHLTLPESIYGCLVAPMQINEEVSYLFPDHIWSYHPGSERWSSTAIKKHEPELISDWEGWFFGHNQSHFVNGKVLIFSHCWKSRLAEGAGMTIDPVSGAQAPLPTENAPTSRIRSVQASSSGMLFVWGGEQCEEDFKKGERTIPHYRDGGIYSLSTGWDAISAEGAPQFSRSMRAVWNGNEFVLWDGIQSLHRYNPQLRKWLSPVPIGVKVDDWTMGMTKQGLLILTSSQAIFIRDSKVISHEIGSPIYPLKLSGGSSYFGSDQVTFYDRGLMEFNAKTLSWRLLSASPYSSQDPLQHLFFTGAEFVVLPSHYAYPSPTYGALFYP